MPKEASDELCDVERHGARAVSVRFFVLEDQGVIFELDDSANGDRDLEHVACEVFDNRNSVANGLAADVPR